MNKEQKYNDALRRAKELHEAGNVLTKTQMEIIFPELKESEEERIRKEIISALKFANDGGVYDKHIAYLEKQEEQKENPKSADSISSDCVSDAKCEDRWHKVEDSLPDNGREVLAKDKLGNTLLARYDGEGWDVSVYDDEDYRCHNGISKWCEIPFEKPKEQKPVEIHIDNPNVQKIDPDVKISTSDSSTGGDRPLYASWRDEKAEQNRKFELIQKSWYTEGYYDREFNREPRWVIKTGEGGPRYEENPKYGQPLIEQRPTEEQLHNLNEAIKSFRMDGFDRIADSLHSLYNCILKTQEQKSAECSVKGRRGRIGNTPEHIRKKAENFLSKMEPPYDADDICSAYETGAMESIKQEWSEDFDKEVENIHKRYPEVSYAKLTRIAYHFSKWASRCKDIEWSEEDEKMRNALWNLLKIQYAQDYSMTGVGIEAGKFRDWLKSLRPQPRQKWSKEETKDLVHILKVLDDCYAYGKHDLSKTDHDNLTSTIKSLRPSWKPSEDEERLINTSISFLKDFADKGYENAVECIDWLKSKLNGKSTDAK